MEIELATLSDLQKVKREILTEMRSLLLQQTEKQEKKWLKSKDIQKLLGISAGTLQTLRNRSLIPYSRLGGVIYYDREEVKKALKNHGAISKLSSKT